MMYEEASQVANDAVGSIRTVASFCAEEKVMQLFRKKCEGPIKTGIRLGLISGTGFGLSSFFLFSFYAASFYAGAKLVEGGHTTFANVFQVGISFTSINFIPKILKFLKHHLCFSNTKAFICFAGFLCFDYGIGRSFTFKHLHY